MRTAEEGLIWENKYVISCIPLFLSLMKELKAYVITFENNA